MTVVITSLKDLIDKINSDLGSFCEKFAYERKELAGLAKAPNRNIFFKYKDLSRDWAINEGGGTEIQYHIYLRDGELGYGLGFNAQYVPYANEKSPIEWIKPYADAFIALLETSRSNWESLEFDWIIGGGEEMLRNPQYGSYILWGKNTEIKDNTIDESFYNQMIANIKGDLFNIYKEVFKRRNELIHQKTKSMELVNKIVAVLEGAKNLILYGAPGTGKTYLAKQMAKQMIGMETDDALYKSEQFAFVQFHPSYDYTDFVEGLRPTRADGSGGIGFELRDGVFKEFCEKARKNLEDSLKDIKTLSVEQQIEEKYNRFIDAIQNEEIDKVDLKTPNMYATIAGLSVKNNIRFKRPSDNEISEHRVSLLRLQQLGKVFKTAAQLEGLANLSQSIRDVIGGCNATWYWAVLHHLYKTYGDVTDNATVNKVDLKNYVFVIDEINRGEISKIFGELFFSIDPNYRGKKGAVYTQYANVHETDEKFYVPENVHIIGTMNDIDRSVESFDFAMRRRFVWQEITAEESAENMNLPKECKDRMRSLNDKISGIEGLGSSYHIGGAYFLDENGAPIKDYEGTWNLRLEPLLREYLRGMPNADDKLDELREAYENAVNN